MKPLYLLAVPITAIILAACSSRQPISLEAPTASPLTQDEMGLEPTSTLPPSPAASLAPGEMSVNGSVMSSSKTITANLTSASDFSLLTQAVVQAGVDKTLQGKGPYTVFAPTDEAIGKMQTTTLTDLMLPANAAKLKKLLTYHVVSGNYTSAKLTDGMKLKTVEGEQLTVNNSNGLWTVTDAQGTTANITTADAASSNGTIFVIDTVLMPQTL